MNTAVTVAGHNVGFVPEEGALSSFWPPIFTLLELGWGREDKECLLPSSPDLGCQLFIAVV